MLSTADVIKSLEGLKIKETSVWCKKNHYHAAYPDMEFKPLDEEADLCLHVSHIQLGTIFFIEAAIILYHD